MTNADMQAGRIRLAQAARHLIYGHPRDFGDFEVRPHKCGALMCIQPLLFGRTNDRWDSLEGASILGDLDIHRRRLIRVWADPILGRSIDLTRYVCR